MYEHIVLDANAFIASVPSSLHSLSHHHWTVSGVLSEIKDPRARATLSALPFTLTPRAPSEENISAIRAFAGKTGDLRALSRTDITVLALARQLEVEVNGDRFLRVEPPKNTTLAGAPQGVLKHLKAVEGPPHLEKVGETEKVGVEGFGGGGVASGALAGWGEGDDDEGEWLGPTEPGDAPIVEISTSLETKSPPVVASEKPRVAVGLITSDFAMQNVALQMGLNLLTPAGKAVASVKSWVLKCDACFSIFPMHGLRPEHALFCQRCGNATLHRLGVTLGADGAPRYHYKKFRQVNFRGSVYPIPEAKGGRVERGESGGRGSSDLLLRPDQLLMGGWKEKMRHAVGSQKALDMAEGPGGEGGAGNLGWGGNSWAGPSAASSGEFVSVEVGYGRRNPNAARRK